jgi:hypothetical protein
MSKNKFSRSLGAEVSRDTSPLTHTYLVTCEKAKRQRNQAAEETKVTRASGIRNVGSDPSEGAGHNVDPSNLSAIVLG